MKWENDTFGLVLRMRQMVPQDAQEDIHKQDIKTQSNLMKSIDRLTDQLANLTTQNKTLQQKINDLLTKSQV